MNNKFIRVISPFTFAFALVLDAAVIWYAYYAILKITMMVTTINILFVIIEIFAIVLAVMVTKEVFSNGIKFNENEVEFTGLDNNNVFEYKSIVKIEAAKDDKASFKKNFIDRYSHIILYLDDESVVTIDLGLTTKKTLKKIENELNSRIKNNGVD